jgi:integrase
LCQEVITLSPEAIFQFDGNDNSDGDRPEVTDDLIQQFLIDRYPQKSRRSRKTHLCKFQDFLEEHSLTLDDLSYFRKRLMKSVQQGESDKSYVRNIVKTTRVFCKWLIRNRLITDWTEVDIDHAIEPVSKKNRGVSQDQILTPDEIQHFLDACESSRQKAMLALGRDAGLRANAVRTVTPADVFKKDQDPPNHFVKVKNSKLGKERTVPVPQNVYDSCAEYLRDQDRSIDELDDKPILTSDRNPSISDQKFYELFNEIRERANIGRPIVFHNLRHTFATRHVQNGVPIRIVSQWLGHEDLQQTFDYYVYYANYTDNYVAKFPWEE